MNKKKKITRIKHRKNKERTKKLLQLSLSKSKPKKLVPPITVKTASETEVTAVIKEPSKKPALKETPTKQAAIKKATVEKVPTKKKPTKKAPAKKPTAKKTIEKKD